MPVLCGVMAQGFGVPSGSLACSHCPARLMPGARGVECPARKVDGIIGPRDEVLTSDTADWLPKRVCQGEDDFRFPLSLPSLLSTYC